MAKYERFNMLLELLATDGQVSVDDAAERLQVSAATIRRDLDSLAARQLLTRTHGGAARNGTSYNLALSYKNVPRADKKLRIARAAAELVPIGSVVGLNGGTTSTEVARALAVRADLHSHDLSSAITVVTNALNIANELIVRSQVKIVVLGGVPRPQSYELTGPLNIPVLNQLSLNIAIIGVDGFDLRHGAGSDNEAEAEVNARIARRASRVVVVADSSKLGRSAFAQIVRTDEVHVLVTDTDADPLMVKELISNGVKVVQA